MRLAVFAYGSLVSPASVERTLGRSVEPARRARLSGWRRGWTQARDNLESEKTFAFADGTAPPWCLGLNVEPDPRDDGPNGTVIGVSSRELDRLALREIRYDRVEVTDHVVPEASSSFDRVFTFTSKPDNLAPSPPPGAVVLASYVCAVEAAFDSLGPGELDLFRETTTPHSVEAVEAVLVRDRIPPGNPRDW
jgi:hypothetical protein